MDTPAPTAEAPTTASGLVLVLDLPTTSRDRVDALGSDVEVTDDLARAGEAALALVSTRTPRAELTAQLARLAEAGSCPVAAVVHTGGEALAVEVVRRGGVAVVAEGNEAGLAALLSAEPAGTGVLDSYEQRAARADGGVRGARGRDAATDLPDHAALELRLDELVQEDVVPRVLSVRVLRTPGPGEVAQEAAALVLRRLAVQFLHVARSHDAQVFAVGPWQFVLVARALETEVVDRLGADLDRIAATYSPTGAHRLGVAVGHAGPEVSADAWALVEAAHRAREAAAADRSQVVVGADALSSGVAATTELEAAMRLVDHVERHAGLPEGHGARVAQLAGVVANELGYDGVARARIQLAGHLHAVGLAGSGLALDDVDALEGEDLATWRAHPARGADYVAVGAGTEVAEIVRAHREHVDGTGFPDGLAGYDIPVGARVVAVARAVEAAARDGALDTDELSSVLRAQAGTVLDTDVVAAAVDVADDLLAVTGGAPALAG